MTGIRLFLMFQESELVQNSLAESKMAHFSPFFSCLAPAMRLRKDKN